MYEAFYRLTGKPFQLNPDPDFFFGSRGHRRAMAYLEYGLHQGEGFIVITGEVGAGKTTLVRNLLRRIPAETIVPAQIVSTQVTADDLLRLVAGSFQINSQELDKSTLLQQLEQRFRLMHEDGKRALLIVDEAQNLSPRAVEELRMLSNFQIGTRSLVQSFLVGQPEFRDILQRPEMRQLKQRVIASYHLGPLDPSETQAYIEHRLGHVGWAQDPSFTADAFLRIHNLTDGVPRRINTLSDRIMLAGYLTEVHEIRASLVDEVAAELADELGTAGPGAQRRSAPAPLSLVSPPQEAVGADGEPGHESDSESQALGDDELGTRLEQLEGRMTLLESTVNTTYNVLQRLLRPNTGSARRDSAPPSASAS